MKKIAVLLLTIFTIGTAALCGCAESSENNNFDDKAKNSENVQVQDIENEKDQNCPDCPEEEKRDGECPEPRRSHKRRNKKLPRPKPAYHK